MVVDNDIKLNGVNSEYHEEGLAEKKIDKSGETEVTAQEVLRRKIVEVFNQDERVKFVVGMGSSAEGKENKLSDVDICIVTVDDSELNEMLGQLDTLFPKFGKLVGSYKYNPYHFYVIFEPNVPLDVYFISSSLYFTVRSDRNKILVDHSNREIKRNDGVIPEECDLRKSSNEEKEKRDVLKDLFLKGFIRTFRLLSKIEKGDFPTLAYILNKIREEQIIPLLSLVSGYNIPHAKAIKLDAFDAELKSLFIDTYCKPEKSSSIKAVISSIEIMKRLFDKASENYDLTGLNNFVRETYEQVKTYGSESF